MAHFEDLVLTGVANKLAREGMKYDIGDLVFVDGYADWKDEFAFRVVKCERILCCGEERRTYDLYNESRGVTLYDIPEQRLRLCRTSTGLMKARHPFTVDYYVPFVPKKVIFHDPATIVLWTDGTKTVVKCSEGDTYDPEKGFMLCYLKKLLGDNYYKYISKTVKKYKED